VKITNILNGLMKRYFPGMESVNYSLPSANAELKQTSEFANKIVHWKGKEKWLEQAYVNNIESH